MFKKLLLLSILSISLTTVANGTYTEVDCSTNSTFGENSCNQCFDGGEVKAGDNLSFLDDIWHNDTTNKKIMYKEEQTMPVLTALNGAEFTKKPNDDTFWEYTSEFEALKSSEFDGYVLPTSSNVSWLKSSMGAAYKVEKTPTSGGNAGILVFNVVAHDILASGEVTTDNKAYKECVIYKAGASVTETPVVHETPKEPKPEVKEMTKVKTGPENYFLVLILSFLLGIGIMNRKLILEKVRK